MINKKYLYNVISPLINFNEVNNMFYKLILKDSSDNIRHTYYITSQDKLIKILDECEVLINAFGGYISFNINPIYNVKLTQATISSLANKSYVNMLDCSDTLINVYNEFSEVADEVAEHFNVAFDLNPLSDEVRNELTDQIISLKHFGTIINNYLITTEKYGEQIFETYELPEYYKVRVGYINLTNKENYVDSKR